MTYIAGLALVVGFIAAWYVGIRAFVWLVFFISSLVPWLGKKHRHDRWDELNKTKGSRL
jgi:hypothetical protein